MKKIFVVFVLFLAQNAFCQAGGSQTGIIKYIFADSFSINNRINISDIDDYIQFVNEKKVDVVFVSNNTFIFEYNSVLYTTPTNGYKTLDDFSDGKGKKFNDGSSYYLAVEQKLSSQNDVDIYRQDLEKATSLGFISILDYRDAVSSGWLEIDNRGNFESVSGLLKKTDLQRSIYYLNILLGLPDKNTSDVIDNPVEYSNRGVKVYNDNFYYILLSFNSGVKDSRFYYACKLAQYNNAADFLTNNNYNNTYGYRNVNIKTTETIYKELHYETYNDCIASINGLFLNYVDYYLAKKYNIGTNSLLSTNRNLINDLEKVKQNYRTDNNGYALLIYYLLKRQKGIPVSVEVFSREFSEEYNRNNWRTINISRANFNDVYTNVEGLKNIVTYDQTGRSFYLK